MDRNGDKEISLAEFMKETKTFLEESEAVELFKAIDNDNTGTLTADEITIELASIRASLILNKPVFGPGSAVMEKATVDYIFKIVDKESKGHITAADLRRVLSNQDEVL
eukprot:CAMPEP_0170476108 /NCGR_PEP_ID=MMETSP0123-20130129/17613_1 /TAXON_ID=182087 /ORGANISM="Favella ehrenbergii, Strain Fehren 1" /LENGTH=108 /DNA_ID=CAMNT_0010746997 /DNA_START=431 /DNA_END=758 /DNA_ORIENTATION=+